MEYSLLDENGFWRSTVTELGLEHMPKHIKDSAIPSVPPAEPAGHLKAWAWDGKGWIAKDNLVGHFFYNPARPKERIHVRSANDKVPANWKYLPPGEMPDPALIEVQEDQWADAKRQREAAELGGFTWDGSRFDSDLMSQSRIQGTAQAAQLAKAAGKPFSVEWTLADNTTRTLNADEMISVGLAMFEHISSTHSKGRQLRAKINRASTAAEAKAVVW